MFSFFFIQDFGLSISIFRFISYLYSTNLRPYRDFFLNNNIYIIIQLDWSQYHACADKQLDIQHMLPSPNPLLLSHFPFNVTKIFKQKRR